MFALVIVKTQADNSSGITFRCIFAKNTCADIFSFYATARGCKFPFATKTQFCAGNFSIPHETEFACRTEFKATNFNVEFIVIAFSPAANQFKICCFVVFHIGICVNTGINCPMVIDIGSWLKTENKAILIFSVFMSGVCRICSLAGIGVFDFAFPNNFVGIFFEFSNANAKSVQFITELSGKSVEFRFVCTARISRHSFSNHLRHFVTGNVAFAAVCTIAVTFDNAFCRQFRD